MAGKPWYREGLRFHCTGCGDCCSGAPGWVWVSPEEILAMADYLGLSTADFESQFVRKVGNRKSLIELEDRNWDCVFLDPDTRKCQIYEVRPGQCRTWPFWESNVKTQKAWEATCQVCPGSGNGNLVPLEEIERQLAVVKI